MAKTQTAGTRKPSKAETAKLAAAGKANLETPTAEKHEITPEQRVADRRADDQAAASGMAQFVAQTLGTDKPAATPPAALEEFEKKLAALKAEYGVTAKVTVKPAKADKLQRNGVTRPGDNTLCGKIWATADAISQATHSVATIAALKEHADVKAINDHTIKTQYAKWRAFNGVTGRLPRIHAVHQTAGEYEGLPAADAPK